MNPAIIFLVAATLLAGCGGVESESESGPETAERETVFDPLLETLDKAEAVQDLELERKRRIDEQIDQH